MMGQEEMPLVMPELLPPGVYPVWSPCDAYEAATILLAALAEENPRFMEEEDENTTD